jgi:hypothetical protein
MGFLDKVKDAAGKAADQAKQATAAGKEKLEDARLGKQVKTLHEEIGALVVASKRGSAPADVDAQIDAKVAEITELEKQIEANDVAPAAGTGATVAVTPPPAAPQNVPTAPPTAPPSAPPAPPS